MRTLKFLLDSCQEMNDSPPPGGSLAERWISGRLLLCRWAGPAGSDARMCNSIFMEIPVEMSGGDEDEGQKK